MKKNNKEYTNNLIFVLASIVVLIALVNLTVTFIKINQFKKDLTGFATDSGYVNITVNTNVVVNVSRNTLNWGPGTVNETALGFYNASLVTNNAGSGTVSHGNWSCSTGSLADCQALVVENLGTSNSTIYIKSDKDAAGLFGSLSSSNQLFQLNVTNKETGSCSGGTTSLNAWHDVNTAGDGDEYCAQFSNDVSSNAIWVNVNLNVPYDAGNTGDLSAILTVTANAA